MGDSDSEEFASADEDFEEIEPDELEEVLQSTKPSDVSSKKTRPQHASSTKSANIDVEPASKTINEANDNQLVDEACSHEESNTCTPQKPTSTDSNANSEEKGLVKPKILEEATDTSQVQSAGSLAVKKDKENLDTDPKLPKHVASKETLTENAKQEPPLAQSSTENEKPDEKDVQNKPIPPITTPEGNSSYKSKKLVLKPAKPQLLEQTDAKVEEHVAKVQEKSSKEEGKSGTDEGWDDFDDDWGDFAVEGGGNVPGKTGDNQKTNYDTQPLSKIEKSSTVDNSTKASFKDVDIDEVEHKLKDFMKHKDDPPLTSVLDRLSMGGDNRTAGDAGQSWGSWKPSWGGTAVSFLSNASKSVASITTNITQVIESGIGVPNPEEMARRQAEAEAKLKSEGYVREEAEANENAPSAERQTEDRFGFDQLVSGVTQISSKVITGGLDTLEGIGKKTMTILQENDPGLLNKRKLLGLQPNDGVVLSQVLREAKAKTEERERNLKQIQKHQYKKKLHFETLFDDYHGLVHLEALEMLSKQASLKLESLMAPLTGKALEELQETMSEVKELCELPETDNDDADGLHTADELDAKLKETIVDLDPNVKVDFVEIVKSWTEYTDWIDNGDGGRTGQDVFEKAMRALAQTTALCVLRMHKLAEILLISEHHSTATEADVLVQLTTVFCWHLSGVATRFCSELTKMKDESGDDNDSALITNIFLEGSNSTSYVQNAFHLFIPILQLGAA
ncbi:protein FAM114A2 [Anopheles funestus]|uniref:protein FAM114A2 n=1 Tax=Anopheles funestus TaxID=62324 RepID=UPI0020C62BF2|nr:protein FAM114A2 [Anopheles funestus]